jgi:hypothetical protein
MSTPMLTSFPLELIVFLFTLEAIEVPPLLLDIFHRLSSPRGASLQPKIYHSLYHFTFCQVRRGAGNDLNFC